MAKEGTDEVEELLEEIEEGICRNNQHGCSAFLSEEHRVEVQLRKPVEDPLQLHLSAHNTILSAIQESSVDRSRKLTASSSEGKLRLSTA